MEDPSLYFSFQKPIKYSLQSGLLNLKFPQDGDMPSDRPL
jgi:hypothetical protein